MHVHILGICGTFMGGLASLAISKGYRVTGSDENVYPPMSTQLESLGIVLQEGYHPWHVQPAPDVVIIGNALKRGNPLVEYVLNEKLTFQSGPQWLAENLLKDRWVIAVAGTHGKTTTSSMIAWILSYAGLAPGFLIGGIPANFGVSAKLGNDPFFVVEADEYDSAFFDKRSKFIHYHPTTCVLNNLEFDHADIFNDLEDIKKQFHHLVRTIPGQGALIVPTQDDALNEVLERGYWSQVITLGENGEWQTRCKTEDGGIFEVFYQGKKHGEVKWPLIGQHNVHNGLAAIAAASHAGVPAKIAIEALGQFQSVKRRMEVRGKIEGVTIYDDFAHHPTAIQTTLAGLRSSVEKQRIIAVLDIRSNTMCAGTHQHLLAQALEKADEVVVYQSPKVTWNVAASLAKLGSKLKIYQETQQIVDSLLSIVNRQSQEHILIMSNGSFDNLHQRFIEALGQAA